MGAPISLHDLTLNATGRFGLVTLHQHQEAPALRIVREQLAQWALA